MTSRFALFDHDAIPITNQSKFSLSDRKQARICDDESSDGGRVTLSIQVKPQTLVRGDN